MNNEIDTIQETTKILNQTLTVELYTDNITRNIFLPTMVHTIFDKLCDSFLPKEEIVKLSTHICNLYSTIARTMIALPRIEPFKKITSPYDNEFSHILENSTNTIDETLWKNNLELLYDTYFTNDESTKIMSMLNEIKTVINFDDFKIFLVQIWLTKLMVADYCIQNKNSIGKERCDKIITYSKSLKYYLSNNIHKKYEYLFGNIIDICTQMVFKLDGLAQISYLSDNIDFVLNFKPDQIINLDKFIVNTIKKNSYHSLIAEDMDDSDKDSDLDIYGADDNDLLNFDITKDDLNSDNEEEEKEINNSTWKQKLRQNIRLVEV